MSELSENSDTASVFENRNMLTPNTEEVRTAWSMLTRNTDSFDCWIEGHDREAKAEAWDEGFVNGYLKAIGGNEKENPYRDI